MIVSFILNKIQRGNTHKILFYYGKYPGAVFMCTDKLYLNRETILALAGFYDHMNKEENSDEQSILDKVKGVKDADQYAHIYNF
jgi:hypothetical protein